MESNRAMRRSGSEACGEKEGGEGGLFRFFSHHRLRRYLRHRHVVELLLHFLSHSGRAVPPEEFVQQSHVYADHTRPYRISPADYSEEGAQYGSEPIAN